MAVRVDFRILKHEDNVLKKYRRIKTSTRPKGPFSEMKRGKMNKKNVTLFVTGLMIAGMIAGTGSICTMAAEKISESKAKEIAAADAGYSVNDVSFDRVEIGTEQGASVYEIEFKTADVEYDYDIAVADGEIVKESWELRHPSAGRNQIGENRAKEIALIDAGLSASDVTFTKVKGGTEDGIAVYEIEFEDVDAEYDYDVTKAGGKIVNASRKVKVPACVAAQEKANSKNKTAKTGKDAAIDAALSHAGFSEDEVSALKCEQDYDDGREIYEVEFKQGGYEYSYDVDANSFSIIEWDKDYDD